MCVCDATSEFGILQNQQSKVFLIAQKLKFMLFGVLC